MIARFVAHYWVHQLQLRSSEARKWAGAPGHQRPERPGPALIAALQLVLHQIAAAFEGGVTKDQMADSGNAIPCAQ